MKNIDFLKTALRDYKTVGALMITSRYAVLRVVGELEPGDRFVIEYGPGDGVITKRILLRLPSDGRIVAIERDHDFRPELEKIGDQRLLVIYGDVAEVMPALGISQADAIVSGIPFSLMSAPVRRDIIDNTQAALRTGGKFIAYQASLLILPLLKRHFRHVGWMLEPRNLPPYFIMTARK
jgi:phospholipid N-methyltransferase